MTQAGDRALADFVTVREAATRTGLSDRYVAYLSRTGTVEGVKLGHDWLVYWPSLAHYMDNRPKPGPKPKAQTTPQGA